jgi:tyrosinase
MANGQTLTRYDITNLNNGDIPGFGVKDPPGWDDISFYYAKALQEMGWNPSGQGSAPNAPPPQSDTDPAENTPNVENTWNYSEEPDSYFFWGAMHWWPGHKWEFFNDLAPAPQNDYWSHCTHGVAGDTITLEKYFLPWHRAYIYFFEVIIRAKVAELGGPENWALPYWNYSFYDPNDPVGPWPRSTLPWIFCQETLRDNTPNPLYLDETRRGLQPKWPDTGEPMRLKNGTPFYAGAYGQQSWEAAAPNSGFNLTLDGRPHGAVHVDTGNGDGALSDTGWMQYTQLAGFDPIFWLHHSEIDRFWVGWNAAGGVDPDNQTDPKWLTAADDSIPHRWNFWANGNISDVRVIHPGDMLDPEHLDPSKFPYSYTYQDLPTVPAPQQAGRQAVASAVPQLATPAAPTKAAAVEASQRVASHDEPVRVEHEPVTTEVALTQEAPRLLASLDAEDPTEARRTVLELDGVVSHGPPGNYEVYLNYPDADRETEGSVPYFVGLLSAFGANHAHGGGEAHGVSASYDITALVAYLRANGEWDDSKVQVTFVPAVRAVAGRKPVTAPVTVGSIRIVTE